MDQLFKSTDEARRHLETSHPGARLLCSTTRVCNDPEMVSPTIEGAIAGACGPHPDLLGFAVSLEDGPWGQGITVYVALPA